MSEENNEAQDRGRAKVRLNLDFFCHEGESISIRSKILHESWVTLQLEALAGHRPNDLKEETKE